MENCAIQPGQVYQHYKKGTLYQIVCLATHSETDKELAVYRDMETNRCFARPLEMFVEHVGEGVNRRKRFALTTLPDGSQAKE